MSGVSQFGVAKVLLDRLNTIESGILPVVPQGGTDAPTDGTQYLREWVLPAGDFPQDLKTGTRQNGVYQVDVLTPKDQGKAPNLFLVDQVKALFVQSEVLTDSGTGQAVKIRWIDTSSMREEGSYWVSSVSVNYLAFGN